MANAFLTYVTYMRGERKERFAYVHASFIRVRLCTKTNATTKEENNPKKKSIIMFLPLLARVYTLLQRCLAITS